MKRTSKIIVVLAVLVAGSMIAGASLLPYFGKITTTATVEQSVKLDSKSYPESWGIKKVFKIKPLLL